MTEIQSMLLAGRDEPYRLFQSRLMPSVDPERILGVRTPALRTLAKELTGTRLAEAFLQMLPHTYYEENNLHGFLIERIRDYDSCVAALDAFLPYVDNWATCDMMSPKVLGRHLPELLQQIRVWMSSDREYTVRFGVGMLMRYFLDASFQPEYLAWVAAISSEAYYVKMMAAWFFATALAKQYDEAIGYLEDRKLDPWVREKAIQKALESNRIPPDRKAVLLGAKANKPQ